MGSNSSRAVGAADRSQVSLGIHWVGLAVLVLIWDGVAAGSAFQAPALFVVPVLLAAWYTDVRWGMSLALGLPLMHLGLSLAVGGAVGRSACIATVGRIVLLGVLAFLASRTVEQIRSSRSLDGLISICSFCKRIRRDDASWQILERYISERSPVLFSHTFCPDCARQRFGDLVGAAPVAPPAAAAESAGEPSSSLGPAEASAQAMNEQPAIP